MKNQKVVFSKKASMLIEKHNIDQSVFNNHSLVKLEDVQKYLSESKKTTKKEIKSSETNKARINYGLINDLKVSSAIRGKNIVWVCINYIFKNLFLNLLVKIASIGIIIFIHRLRGVKIGKGCFLDPSAIIETAYPSYVSIGQDVRVAAGSVIMTHIKAPEKLRNTGAVPLINKLCIGRFLFYRC